MCHANSAVGSCALYDVKRKHSNFSSPHKFELIHKIGYTPFLCVEQREEDRKRERERDTTLRILSCQDVELLPSEYEQW